MSLDVTAIVLESGNVKYQETSMKAESLTDLVQEHLERARTASSGRSAHTVHGGHENRLRQTLVALAAGHQLDEHESPGEATLQVLAGTVTLVAGEARQTCVVGDLVPIPASRHSLEAVDDSAVLLTVVVQVARPAATGAH